MKVVIDTNVLISILPRKSQFNTVFTDLIKGRYSVVITPELYLEYEEILLQKSNPLATKAFFEFLSGTMFAEIITVYFNWRLMVNDPDDNKFVDAYIASGADYIVTEDAHFNILQTIPFPPVKVISLNAFKRLLDKAS
jgi:putative PIN family toxin of toxin-antitoxin system